MSWGIQHTLNFSGNSFAARKNAHLLRLLGLPLNPCKPFRSQSLGFCESSEPVHFVVRQSFLSALLPTQPRCSCRSASYLMGTIYLQVVDCCLCSDLFG